METIVAGIDVGGMRKGFHAVALRDGKYLAHMASRDVDAIVQWCLKQQAAAIGVDAPCCWSRDGRARKAERELMAKRISCFSTPTRERAEQHPKDYFGWMRNGAQLYEALQSHYRLFDGASVRTPVCFETFPHAIACELSGGTVQKKDGKRRRDLLETAGITTAQLTNADLRDAALCALSALALLQRKFVVYGHKDDGLIVVPNRAADPARAETASR
jgi:predicted nuclease with RNAse H fold